MICGVDEAGKGSVLGPMVVAAVGAENKDDLRDLPVKDSKLLTPRQRSGLYAAITMRCRIATIIIPADRIDLSRTEITMNECVARAHASVIRRLRPEAAYVDACDVNERRYARMVRSHLTDPCTIISEHHADETYPIVSAASIVAKVVRDAEIEQIAADYGPIGSGYPSDPDTIAYLSAYIRDNRRPPPIARKSWKTVTILMDDLFQTRLI